MMTSEQIETRSKKVRGMAKASTELIEAMAEIAEAAEPITGRGVGYKLFTAGLIPSMSTPDMQKVYRLLRLAREDGTIPWEWIVDETRALNARRVGAIQKISSSLSGASTAETIGISSRFASRYGARKAPFAASSPRFRQVRRRIPRHGWVHKRDQVHDIADDDDGRDLIALYCGDYDPSGLYMSEHDLPDRLDKYEGYHVNLKRIALTARQTPGLPSFPPKPKDTRYKWDARNPATIRKALEDFLREQKAPMAEEPSAPEYNFRFARGSFGAEFTTLRDLPKERGWGSTA